jgi:hypothetical protein
LRCCESQRLATQRSNERYQVAALAAVFGVDTSYLVDRKGAQPSLDAETLVPLSDETANSILRESVRLPEREKRIVLGIVREFERQRLAQPSENRT